MKTVEKICSTCKHILSTNEPCINCVRTSGFEDMWEMGDFVHLEQEGNKPKTRADFLKDVEGIICKDRNEQYGEPEDNFKRIAVFWSNYLDIEITSADVAIMMVLFKAARIATGHNKEDNWIDIAGYSLCGAECAFREK